MKEQIQTFKFKDLTKDVDYVRCSECGEFYNEEEFEECPFCSGTFDEHVEED